jgi:hypothetical protein
MEHGSDQWPDTTQYKNIISAQNNLKFPSTNMHKIQQRKPKV